MRPAARFTATLTLSCAAVFALVVASLSSCARPAESFAVLEVRVEAGDARLAAYQLDLSTAHTTIVGVEGGDAPFDAPPHYDPAALRQGRIRIGAFTTDDAPRGEVLVARLHVLVRGEETYTPSAVLAARPDGESMTVPATVERVE